MTADIQALRDSILRDRLEGTGTSAAQAISTADRAKTAPLSPSQRRLWFLDSINPDSGEYHIPMVLRLRGTVDTEALRRAWTRVLDRH
jgi:hypothetical protein